MGDGHADPASQAGDDDAKDQGCDPSERRACRACAVSTPFGLQTTLTPAQEAVAVALRKSLLVSLDDLLAVVQEFLNSNASRSAGSCRMPEGHARQLRHRIFAGK